MSVPLRIEYTVEAERTERRPVRRHKMSPAQRTARFLAAASILSVLGLAFVGAGTVARALFGPSDLRLMPSGSSAGLAAVLGSAHRNNGYVTVTGSIANTGNAGATNVEAVVELVDSSNRTIQLDKSMIAFADVPAGNSSPFRVIVPDDANATGYRLSFRHPDGREIQ